MLLIGQTVTITVNHRRLTGSPVQVNGEQRPRWDTNARSPREAREPFLAVTVGLQRILDM